MKNSPISEISSLITPKLVKSTAWAKNGFSTALDEAILAGDRKKNIADAGIKKKGFEYSDDSINQLVNTSNQMNMAAAKGHVSAGMLDLYMAQERKDEKTGRGRMAVTAGNEV